jgi:uncharacterized membrane protein
MSRILLSKAWLNGRPPWPILIHLCFAIPLAVLLNIWVDEAYSLNTTDHGLRYAITQALTFENQPPLYFAILAVWRLLNPSIFFARSFSILCTVLAIATCYPLAKRYLPDTPRWILPLIFALHPYTLWASLEIRLYGLTLWLTTLLLFFFFDGYLATHPRPLARWGYLLTAIAALATHYFFACLLVAQAITLWLNPRWKRSLNHLAAITVAGLCLLPTVPIVLAHRVVYPIPHHWLTEIIETIKAVPGRAAKDLVPLANEAVTVDIGVFKIIPYLVLLGLLLLIGIRHRAMNPLQRQLTVLWGSNVGVMALLVLGSQVAEHSSRYGFHLFVVTILWAIAIAPLAKPWISPRGFGWVLGIVLMCYLGSVGVTYAPLAKAGDWQRVATYLQRVEAENQPILLFANEAELPLRRYYQGKNQLFPLPRPMGEEVFDQRQLILENDQSLRSLLLGPEPVEQFWLVLSPGFVISGLQEGNCEIYRTNLNCQVLTQFMEQHYQVQSQQEFLETIVQEMSLKE